MIEVLIVLIPTIIFIVYFWIKESQPVQELNGYPANDCPECNSLKKFDRIWCDDCYRIKHSSESVKESKN